MPIDTAALETQIQNLSKQTDAILAIPHNQLDRIRREYQTWYSQVHLIVKTHLPERLAELKVLYTSPRALYAGYYGIASFLDGTFRDRTPFVAQLEQQRGILLAVPHVIALRALEVAALVTADLVQGELNQARLLLEHGFIRAAGAVAGVALEAHLKLLHDQADLAYTDKDTIVPLATRLRKNGFISIGDEKKCIAMADTRNRCDHKKTTDPTQEEVEELLGDVDRFTKRVQVI
ncbi:MAG: hypothetical protein IMY86_04540 [Chloroflexi bacterium]|nr:hypothetical protein [Chloroflexota bacterium]